LNTAGGIHTDSDPANQPPGTTRYVLCGVDETEEGSQGRISNESANQLWFMLPDGQTDFVPLGKVYVGDGETVLFLADPAGNSMIASVKGETFSPIVDDTNQTAKLGFNVNHQIDATFRLRRGCERTIYWVDPKPRTMNIDDPMSYRDENYRFNIDKFNLFKTYKSIPEIQSIKAIEGGQLAPGSYNFSFQYLDEDFNPTEFVFSTEPVVIYPKALTSDYKDIRGGTMKKADYLSNALTTKAVRLDLNIASIDKGYPFYRLAITEANTGNGLVSATKFTAPIPTSVDTFTYTGSNFESEGIQEEIMMFNNIIDKAQSIEQAENQLILGNVEGPGINFCKLQKYASQIKTDAVIRQVNIGSLEGADCRNPSIHHDETGYMPGEIYSMGIVYIFEDNTLSPTYHIPGKSPLAAESEKYAVGDDVYPMAKNNTCIDASYTERDTCDPDGYWGNDYLGNPLAGQKVRHHRFPLRTTYRIPFITELPKAKISGTVALIKLQFSIPSSLMIKAVANPPVPLKGKLVIPAKCPEPGQYGYTSDCISYGYDTFSLVVRYRHTRGWIQSVEEEIFSFDPNKWAISSNESVPEDVPSTIVIDSFSRPITGAIELLSAEIFEKDGNGNTAANNTPLPIVATVTGYDFSVQSPETGVTYSLDIVADSRELEESTYVANIFGFKFSNILLPLPEETGGKKIIGYYIVRNERTEPDRTVLDSAVLLPNVVFSPFISQGLLNPEFADPSTAIKKDSAGLLYPEHKFKQKNYEQFSHIIEQGRFEIKERIKSRTKINDVIPGVTSYVKGKHKDSEKDEDGMTLHIKTREGITAFSNSYLQPGAEFDLTPITKEIFYLNALEDKAINDNEGVGVDYYNNVADNKIGMITFTEDAPIYDPYNRYPYVYLMRDNLNPYANFRTTPYYKDSKNPTYFSENNVSSLELFNGDSYISPIRYVNSMWYDNRFKERVAGTSVWKFVAATFLVIAAAVVTFFSFGAGTPLLIAALGAASLLVGIATSLAVSGLSQVAWAKAYQENYDKGLRKTIQDQYTLYGIELPATEEERGFSKNPADDEIQWLGDCANLWFESNVNIGTRISVIDGIPDFLSSPTIKEPGTLVPEGNWLYFGNNRQTVETIDPTTSFDSHMVKKLTYPKQENKQGKEYMGVALAEIYEINPDYERRNKQKVFNHLPIEYDCCSECLEVFTHRWHWSQTSFQEELTDNYRTFLPNNYRDLAGETGDIVDIFKIKNNLFIHTEEALWMCPQNFQERTTAEGIVSFIGTGELFNIPPRKIVDDENSSAGTQHKWGRTKTKYGVLFPSHREKKWYLFNGEQLQPISDNGNRIWFDNNMKFRMGDDYSKQDNPSNYLGVGYISTFDTEKERLIITKKDISPNYTGVPEDYCTDTNTTYRFENAFGIIWERNSQGWTFVGYENCRMKFKKVTQTVVTKDIPVTTWVPPVYEQYASPIDCTQVEIHYSFTRNDTTQSQNITISMVLCSGNTYSYSVPMAAGVSHVEKVEPTLLCIRTGSLSWSKTGGAFIAGNLTGVDIPYAACNTGTTVVLVEPGHFEETVKPTQVTEYTIEYEYEDGEPVVPPLTNSSWTMSFSLRRNEWRSWHPYLPSFYFHIQGAFWSWKDGLIGFYKHNITGWYQTFYNVLYPFIVEYVDNVSAVQTKLTDSIMFQSEATNGYGVDMNQTFNSALFYNSQQTSGVLKLMPKAEVSVNYMLDQVKNRDYSNGEIIIDRNERNWTINSFRDIRGNLNVPMFNYNYGLSPGEEYYDKVVNPDAIDPNKDWTQLESFRDKYLAVRLIFDNFANTQLTFHLSQHDEKSSER
jgi:membrane protein implicated in regulation of membrane protease activity